MQQGRAMAETRPPVDQRRIAGEQATQLLDITTEQRVHHQLEVRVRWICSPCFYVGPVGEPVFPGDGLPSIVQRELAVHDLVGRVAYQLGMPTGDVRNHRTVPSFVSLDNPVRLLVQLVTDGKFAKAV